MKKIAIDKKKIFVLDDFYKPSEFKTLNEFVKGAAFVKGISTFKDGDYKCWYFKFDIPEFAQLPFVSKIHKLIEKQYKPGFKLARVMCVETSFGDVSEIHNDCDSIPNKQITALTYLNEKWDLNWGGETMFYNDKLTDTEIAVTPKPKRLLVFDGAINHKTGEVSRTCMASRYVLVMNYTK